MFEISELERLAARLNSAADVAEAKVRYHLEHKEPDDAQREQERADSGRHFSQVCVYFVKVLKAKERAKKWQPPTVDEVVEYAKAAELQWPRPAIQEWWDYYQSVEWKVGKNKMKDWQAAARNGARRWREKKGQQFIGASPQRNGNGLQREPDPEGWREFITTVLRRPYKEFALALPYQRQEFLQKRRK